MAVYIDKMNAKYKRMIMCHMFADSEDELKEMARKIGVDTKWIQYPGSYRVHFDICLAMKEKALSLGAVEITHIQLRALLKKKKRDFEIKNKELR